MPGDDSLTSGEMFWVLPVTEGMTRLPDSCAEAVDSVTRAIEVKPGLRIELIAYADPIGSASFGLARVSSIATQLRAALLHKNPRMKIRILTRLLPTLGAYAETPAIGRIMLRVPHRSAR